jgi:tetratricopeptide (TPR) repeat protein
MKALRRASELEPTEASCLLNMHMVAAEAGKKLAASDHEETINRLSNGHISASTILALKFLGECISTTCASLQGNMETWLKLLLNRSDTREYDASFYYHLLGRTLLAQEKMDEAINAYKRSYQLDPKYLHPLFELGYLYLSLQRIEDAEATLIELQHANRGNKHPRDADIEKFSNDIKVYQKLRHVKPRN